ncbi:MAG: hypothetical protein LBQ77_06155 [Treponema sp.]|nr:hypothetical protein [Treponema sp.]
MIEGDNGDRPLNQNGRFRQWRQTSELQISDRRGQTPNRTTDSDNGDRLLNSDF